MPASHRVVPLLLVVLLGACTTTQAVAPEDPPSPAAAPAPVDPPTTPTAPTVPTPPGDTRDVPVCADDDEAALDAVVTAQLAAMAAADWDAALALTSTGFRAAVDADGLERIIAEGFPVVAANVGHVVLGCLRDGAAGQLLVLVTADDGATRSLAYALALEDGEWRIAGATPQDDPGSGLTV